MDCAKAVCVVTGASSGLGQAVASELLRRGARVAALDIGLCSDFDGNEGAFRRLCADITDADSIKAALADAAQAFGAIHACINCAGTVSSTPMLQEDGRASSCHPYVKTSISAASWRGVGVCQARLPHH
jgi:NAD(P)-dependent dehydrogenase (short-subunit alcohol dehydrogenase family)